MRYVWVAAVLVMLMAGVAQAEPQSLVWSQKVGKETISVPMPKGAQQSPQTPGMYLMELGDPKGRPVVRIIIKLAASADHVPKTPAEIQADFLKMIHNTRLAIKDSDVTYSMLPPATNATLDMAYGGFCQFKGNDGQMVILSPNIFIGKKKELVAPFTILAIMLDKKSVKSDADRVQKYLEGALREMVRGASAR